VRLLAYLRAQAEQLCKYDPLVRMRNALQAFRRVIDRDRNPRADGGTQMDVR